MRFVGVRVGVANLDQSIGTNKTNTFQLKLFIKHYNCGHHRFGWFVDVKVGMASLCNKHALRTRLRNINLKSQFSNFYSF